MRGQELQTERTNRSPCDRDRQRSRTPGDVTYGTESNRRAGGHRPATPPVDGPMAHISPGPPGARRNKTTGAIALADQEDLRVGDDVLDVGPVGRRRASSSAPGGGGPSPSSSPAPPPPPPSSATAPITDPEHATTIHGPVPAQRPHRSLGRSWHPIRGAGYVKACSLVAARWGSLSPPDRPDQG